MVLIGLALASVPGRRPAGRRRRPRPWRLTGRTLLREDFALGRRCHCPSADCVRRDRHRCSSRRSRPALPGGRCHSRLCARAAPAAATANTTRPSAAITNSRRRIADLAAVRDAARARSRCCDRMNWAAHGEQFGQCRLDIAGLIDGTALNHGAADHPTARAAESGQGPGQHRLLQFGLPPAPAVINRDIDAADLAMTAPGKPADLVKAGRIQPLAARRAA